MRLMALLLLASFALGLTGLSLLAGQAARAKRRMKSGSLGYGGW